MDHEILAIVITFGVHVLAVGALIWHLVSGGDERPDWMDEETYNQIPETMEIRQVRIHVGKPGFRTRVLDLATTLLDAEMYTKADLATLFRQRWHAER